MNSLVYNNIIDILSQSCNVPNKDHLLVTFGSDRSLQLLSNYFRRKKVLIMNPTYNEVVGFFNNDEYIIDTIEDNSYKEYFNIQHLYSSLEHGNYDVLYIVNPNNPTGLLLKPEVFLYILYNYKHINLIIDECYIQYVVDSTDFSMTKYVNEYPNLHVVRSFSKYYALAGCRLGFMVSQLVPFINYDKSELHIKQLKMLNATLSISDDYFKKQTRLLDNVKKQFIEKIQTLGLKCKDIPCNFINIYVGDDASSFYDKLLQKDVLARDVQKLYNMKGYIRITVEPEYVMNEIYDIFKDILNENVIIKERFSHQVIDTICGYTKKYEMDRNENNYIVNSFPYFRNKNKNIVSTMIRRKYNIDKQHIYLVQHYHMCEQIIRNEFANATIIGVDNLYDYNTYKEYDFVISKFDNICLIITDEILNLSLKEISTYQLLDTYKNMFGYKPKTNIMVNKSVILIGGSKGIGIGICETLIQNGCENILIMSRNPKNLRQLKNMMFEKYGVYVNLFAGDITDSQTVQDLFKYGNCLFGTIDVFIQNVGTFPIKYLEQMTLSDWNDNININLTGTFLSVKEAYYYMKKQNYGKIVITSSITGNKVGFSGLSHYSAAKAGINGFIKSAALELSEYNININGVEPGSILTDELLSFNEATLDNIKKSIPLNRIGSIYDIGNAILFLASGLSDFVTGQTICVDGGQTLPEVKFS